MEMTKEHNYEYSKIKVHDNRDKQFRKDVQKTGSNKLDEDEFHI